MRDPLVGRQPFKLQQTATSRLSPIEAVHWTNLPFNAM